MALASFFKITDSNGSVITAGAGDTPSLNALFAGGMEDYIPTYESHTALTVATDPVTGQPISTARGLPVTFKGAHTKATPLVWEVLTKGDTCEIEQQIWRISQNGARELLTTNEYGGCVITGQELVTPDTTDSDCDSIDNFVNVTFTFAQITSTHETGNSEFSYDTSNPPA